MSKNIEVFRQTLALLDTISDAFEHIKALMAEGKKEEALEMLYDALSGADSIINALAHTGEQLPYDKLHLLQTAMSDKSNRLIDVFKASDGAVLSLYMESDLIPAFTEWKRELERLLMPLILS